MANTKILLVDDEKALLQSLSAILTMHEFDVTTANTVADALRQISSQPFDALLSDLHMPGAGDGLTVVSAMRHANPKAVTMLLSAFPEMTAASHAILLQADEILVKPMDIPALIAAIKQRVAQGAPRSRVVESVATILERTTDHTILDWLRDIEAKDKLKSVPLTSELRSAHLPQLFVELVNRLRSSAALGSKDLVSASARAHGILRRKQGYTAAMVVEESRMLQVNIFRTLQENLMNIDFSILLIGVMTIADEVDSQLSQQMESYTAESQRYDLGLI
ncbi:MAG TPA: response regulator [Acidobacteriaceae bacterium]|nr:response regulator [Acidobacteriaceae bacterium]